MTAMRRGCNRGVRRQCSAGAEQCGMSVLCDEGKRVRTTSSHDFTIFVFSFGMRSIPSGDQLGVGRMSFWLRRIRGRRAVSCA